jgi:hypothetical protein
MFFYSRAGVPMKNCTWKCGGKTKNNTGICDDCWRNREAIYVARKAREAAAEKNPNRQAAGRKGATARHTKVKPHLPATGTFSAD